MRFQIDSKIFIKPAILILCSVLCGILDYFICDLVAWKLNLPLFCDTIFIMAISFTCGPLWGILAGFFYHAFDALLSGEVVLGQIFILCHFAAAILAGFYKKSFIGEKDSTSKIFIKLAILSLFMCILMSICGGIISHILSNFESFKDGTSQTDFLSFLLENAIKQKLLLSIVVRIPVNIADRFLCVFAAWGVYVLVAKKILKQNYSNFFNS